MTLDICSIQIYKHIFLASNDAFDVLASNDAFDVDIDIISDLVWTDIKSIMGEGAKIVILTCETKWSKIGEGWLEHKLEFL